MILSTFTLACIYFIDMICYVHSIKNLGLAGTMSIYSGCWSHIAWLRPFNQFVHPFTLSSSWSVLYYSLPLWHSIFMIKCLVQYKPVRYIWILVTMIPVHLYSVAWHTAINTQFRSFFHGHTGPHFSKNWNAFFSLNSFLNHQWSPTDTNSRQWKLSCWK